MNELEKGYFDTIVKLTDERDRLKTDSMNLVYAKEEIDRLKAELGETNEALAACQAEGGGWKSKAEKLDKQLMNIWKVSDGWQSRCKKLAEALRGIITWSERLGQDHHEKLVLNQTFESACENWDSLLQDPLDLSGAKAALAEFHSGVGEEE